MKRCVSPSTSSISLSAANEKSTAVPSPHPVKKLKQQQQQQQQQQQEQQQHPLRRHCPACNVSVSVRAWVGHLNSQTHKNHVLDDINKSSEHDVKIIKTAFGQRIISYKIALKNKKPQSSLVQHPREFISNFMSTLIELIHQERETHYNIKVNLELFGWYYLPTKDSYDYKSFNTRFGLVNRSTELNEFLNKYIDDLSRKAVEFKERDSGWALQYFTHIELNIAQYNPLNAGSYIPLPKTLRYKNAVINIKNNDTKCFQWSILAHIHPSKNHAEHITSYLRFEKELQMGQLESPMKLSNISKFEAMNDNISINVYGWEKVNCDKEKPQYQVVGPLYMTQQRKSIHVNLLYISDDYGHTHFCLIRSMSRLVSSQINRSEKAIYLCDGCLISFTTKQRLQIHQKYDCGHVSTHIPNNETLRCDYLGDNIRQNILKFENYKNQFKANYVIYADFESLQLPIHTVEADPNSSYTAQTAIHVPYSWAYFIKCSFDDNLSILRLYRGKDCIEQFVNSLTIDVTTIWSRYHDNNLPIKPLSLAQEYDFSIATHCHICDKEFDDNDLNKKKVKDHSHATGEYRGAAHTICNLHFQPKKFIPCFLHNMSHFDCHLFIKELSATPGSIDVVAQNKETYISFSKHIKFTIHDIDYYYQIRFLDSFRFMSMSLNNLSQNLEIDQCIELRKYFPQSEHFALMRYKGVFPYSYVDSFDKLNDDKLPTYEEFYDRLRDTNISPDDYVRAQNIWTTFKCSTLGDYSDLYLQVDCLLLTDIFESFRKICFDVYGLDPTNYMTAPSLAWDAMLKYTNVELELLTDIDMIHFIKNNIRGGISQCSGRRAIANNQFSTNQYDPLKPTTFLMYLDACNLYGGAMSQPLPISDFRWLSESEIENLNLNTLDNNNALGYIFEVDIEYPPYLHDEHNELPFCVESFIPPISTSKNKKLIPNLFNKQKYVIHFLTLKQALGHGLKLQKIYRVLQFHQRAWLKPYIDLNTEQRNKSRNKFEKDFYKLMVNTIYGKSTENVDKRVDIKLSTHWKNVGKRIGAQNLIAKPHFKNLTIFTEDFCAIQMNKVKVEYFKPTYIGFSVLEISKHIMYDFYYNFIKNTYGDKALLLYMDTDSLILEITTTNFYNDLKNNIDHFDTSNYPLNNVHGIPINPSKLGKMKDEYAGRILDEFIGTGAKAYIIKCEDQLSPKAKGIAHTISSKFTLDSYRNIVDNIQPEILTKFLTFRSHLHTIYTEMVNKVALSYFDDKRILIPNSYRTYAWGHYRSLQDKDNENTTTILD